MRCEPCVAWDVAEAAPVKIDVRSEKMKKIVIIASVILASICIVPVMLYFGFLFLAHDCNPAFLKIDICLDAG